MYGYGQQYPPIRSRVFNWILFMGKIVHLVGMLSPYWVVNPLGHLGIWLWCFEPIGCTSVYNEGVLAAWLRAVQAMAILGTIVSLFGMICIIVFLRTGNRTLLTPGAAGAVLAGVLVIIGVIIYGAEFNNSSTTISSSLDWAFYLEAVSGVIMLTAGIGQFTQVFRPSQ